MVGPLHIKEAFRMTLLFMELSMKTHLKEFWIRRNWLDNHAWMVVGAFSTNVDIRYSTQKMTPLTISLLQPISNLSGISISTIPNHWGSHQSPRMATHTPQKKLFPLNSLLLILPPSPWWLGMVCKPIPDRFEIGWSKKWLEGSFLGWSTWY